MEYLDFELPIKELEDQLEKCVVIGKESDVETYDDDDVEELITEEQLEENAEEDIDLDEMNLKIWKSSINICKILQHRNLVNFEI